jgi:single-strand DNA-binding protein
MARSLNKVMLIGNLGSDPEIKYAANGNAIASIRIATAESRKNRDGEWEDTTEWHRVVMFGRQAELCKDYLKKGSKIYVEGRLQTRSWEDQSGQRHYATEIVGFNMLMLDSRSQDASTGVTGPQGAPVSEPSQALPAPDFPEAEDDLPF